MGLQFPETGGPKEPCRIPDMRLLQAIKVR